MTWFIGRYLSGKFIMHSDILVSPYVKIIRLLVRMDNIIIISKCFDKKYNSYLNKSSYLEVLKVAKTKSK